jgi:hypothetical protein
MPSSQVNFTLTSELSEKIRALACEGLNTFPAGAEIGGIITTLSHPASPEYDVRLVRCDHKFGPLWRLSAEELSKLEQTVGQTLSEGKIVVAYFRSCTRPRIDIELADRDNIDVACRGIPFIVLAKPSRSGTSQINVFGRSAKGEWELTESVSARSPFEPGAMPAVQENNKAVLLAANREIPRVSRSLLAIAAAMLLITAAILWFKGRSPNHPVVATSAGATPVKATPAGTAAPPPSPKLGLVVTEENGKLHATWNHDSPAARSAIVGSLLIRDSERSQDIELSRADVTGGSIVYTPRSGDITFRLVLTNSAIETSAEMIRFIGGQSHLVESRTQVSTTDALVSATAPRSASVAPPAVTASAAVTPPAVAPSPVTPPPVTAPDPAAGADRKTPAAVVPPALEVANASAAPNLVPAHTTSEDPIPPPAPVGNRPAPGVPSIGSSVPAPVPQATVPPTRAIASTPPIPLRTSQPTKADRASWKLYSPVTIPITVNVDASGRVMKAFPSVKPDPRINPFLVQLCINSAMEWVFKPATREGRPVPAEFGIEFRFKADSER